MAKRMLIDATHTEETRAVIVSGNRLEEFDFESTTKTQLKGNIYLAKVTRVEPSLQAAFVDYGGNRHGFLAFSEIHPDYYRIPVADREALLAEVSNQRDDIDIDDSGVEEIDDDEAGMDTTSPHDDDGAAHEGGIEATSTDEADAEDGEGDEKNDQAEDTDPGDDAEGRSVAADASDGNENAEGAPAEVSEAAGDTEENAAETSDGDPEGTTSENDDDDGDDGDKGPSYARMDQEDAAVTSKKPDGPEDDGAGEPTEDSDQDASANEGVDEANDDADAAETTADQDQNGDHAPSPAQADDGDDAVALSSEGDNAEPSDASESATNDDAGGPAKRRESREEGRDRTPSSRRRRGRGRRDRDAESVGGEDAEEFNRSKAWHRRYRIQEVISRRQILLVQVAKEERGNKGAALTTYISLAGRYCVLMPNTPRGGGISRKIANPKDRRKIKEIVDGLNIPSGMAVIVRTAGSERTKAEIRRDYEYLLKLWDEIRERTLISTAPSLIHEEANLIKRSIRDLYSKDIDEVLVEGEDGYKTAKGFMRLLMPSHAKRVKIYKEEAMPLFHRYQVESQIDNIYIPTVQLKSGGYIVLNATEALVAIDVNSGRATRERNIEETAYRTNLEAADEIARQLRLRDLAGLIVIDFIDMEEGRNRYNVERRLKEAMKHDRARIQLGRISAFGLLEMSRQRLRPSIAEISAQPCPTCGGSGVVRSIESSALQILRAIEEEGMRQRSTTLTVSLPPEVAFYIMNNKRPALTEIEARYELTVFLRGDDKLVPPAHEIAVGDGDDEAAPPPTSRRKSDVGDEQDRGRKRRSRRRRPRSDEEDEATPVEATEPDADDGDEDDDNDDRGNRRGSRRRGRRGGRKRTKRTDGEQTDSDAPEAAVTDTATETADDAVAGNADAADSEAGEEQRAPRRRRRRRTSGRSRDSEAETTESTPNAGSDSPVDAKSDQPAETVQDTLEPSAATDHSPADETPSVPAPVETSATADEPAAPEPVDTAEASSPPDTSSDSSADNTPDSTPGKRRGGWWSFGKNGS